MKTNEYVKTIVVYGKMVNVGMDDTGQQYFIEYLDDNGELQIIGCGAYNSDYEGFAKMAIDRRRFMIELLGEEEVLEMEKYKKERLEKYDRN